MNESAYHQFLATHTAIEERAKEVFVILARHWGYANPSAWEASEIVPEGVYMSRYYCGEDDTKLVRLDHLVSADPEALIATERKAYLQAQAEQLLADREMMKRRQEANERADLDRLIAKYGVPRA